MRVAEAGLAALLVLGGIRSLWIWLRRPFEPEGAREIVLYAVCRTGRVGLWFAFGGLFAIYASSDAAGRALIEETRHLRWYALVPVGLGSAQLIAGFALSRRRSGG